MSSNCWGASRLCEISTRWSKLRFPTDHDDPAWHASWTYLFERYSPAMRRYVHHLLRQFRRSPPSLHEVEDVVQSYLAASLEKDWLSAKEERIRKFRAFLQKQLRRFTLGHLRKLGAKKRGGDAVIESLGHERVAGSEPDPSAQEFERGWIDVAVERAVEELGRLNPRYRKIILELIRAGPEGLSNAELAENLDEDPDSMPVKKHRAKRRFAVLLAGELRQTVTDDEAFEAEWAILKRYIPWVDQPEEPGDGN